jgi:hypothetical protein
VRRGIGVVALTALAVALRLNVAGAAELPTAGGPDLGPQIMLRLFGETTDSNASFFAEQGDRSSESPLRDLALQVRRAGVDVAFEPGAASAAGAQSSDSRPLASDAAYLDAAAAAGFAREAVRFSPAANSRDDAVANFVPSDPLLTAAYQPVGPAANVSPAPGTLAFGPASSDSAPSTLQLGRVQFEGHAGTAAASGSQLSPSDNSYDAGAHLDVRAGRRNLSFNLSSSYEHLAGNDAGGLSSATFDPASSWVLPGGDASGVVPNYADLNRYSIRAGLAVPVVHGVTLDVNYGAQRLYGGYGMPGLLNLDAANAFYGGKLTFQMPFSSTLSISASQNHYQDALLPLNGYTQTREDVNLTVKF